MAGNQPKHIQQDSSEVVVMNKDISLTDPATGDLVYWTTLTIVKSGRRYYVRLRYSDGTYYTRGMPCLSFDQAMEYGLDKAWDIF